MSGSTPDTSAADQRRAVVSAIENVGLANAAQAQAVQNCTLPLPLTAALLLDMGAPGVTFATAAAQPDKEPAQSRRTLARARVVRPRRSLIVFLRAACLSIDPAGDLEASASLLAWEDGGSWTMVPR